MRGVRKRTSSRPGVFDPSDEQKVRYTKYGIWDFYEAVMPSRTRLSELVDSKVYWEMVADLPFVWRMLKDIASIRSCWLLLVFYFMIEFLISLIPAITLWYSSQLLQLVGVVLHVAPASLRFPSTFSQVQEALEKRQVDKDILIRAALARIGCALADRTLRHILWRVRDPLMTRIKQYFSGHIFHSMARLDVPTFGDTAVQRQLEQALIPSSHSTLAWKTLTSASSILSLMILIVTQISVLANVLKGQRDGPLLALLSCAPPLLRFRQRERVFEAEVWAATTKDAAFIKTQGMKRLVSGPAHRKEIVAGGMWDYLTQEYQAGLRQIGDHAGDFYEIVDRLARLRSLSLYSFLADLSRELPQIVFTIRAVQYPSSIPLSLASLNLITQTTRSFYDNLRSMYDQTGSLAGQMSSVRKFYEAASIPNRVLDGSVPFPEDQQAVSQGVSVEFRNVFFRYPGSEKYALRDVSFEITKGQLCVIVGDNGSGKSTILKLITRLYDVTDGMILIDGQDIKTLRLDDLRRAASVLFQDYTHFPLSIKDNIGLGDPANAQNNDMIAEAARLGGAEGFIGQLPEGFDTYLERPVQDYYSGLPEGTKTVFGRPVDFSQIRRRGGLEVATSKTLSGGQMQRIALSRTFMRSLSSQSGVGLLLYDEPSASLDPTAEHDLFQRLRQLRMNKTMIFSSHRFGNLTRHADLILYMNDSEIVESGNHQDLLKRGGEYARIWGLQAAAFLP